MKLFLLLTILSSIATAQMPQFGGPGNGPTPLPPYGDRPNFICQTAPNAARMYLKAYVHTYFHSKTIKVTLTHISTYREELVATHTSRPTVMKPNELRLDRPAKSNNVNDMFPAFNFAPAITYQLVHRTGKNWLGQFSVVVQNSPSEKAQVRKYNMNCEKM
jgi:hypothetical protein